MRHFLTIPILLGLMLLPLTACSGTSENTTADAETEHSADDGHDHSKDEEKHSVDDGHDHSKDEEKHSKGGQVVESDPYHIELVTEPKDDGTQLNLYLLHEAEERVITDAQVTANVQQPDGEQQTVKMVYEPAEEVYTGLLAAKATGQYDLVMQTEIGGEKINSRFSIEK